MEGLRNFGTPLAVTPYMTSEEVHLERIHIAAVCVLSRTTRLLCDDALVSSQWHADQTRATLLAVHVFG